MMMNKNDIKEKVREEDNNFLNFLTKYTHF